MNVLNHPQLHLVSEPVPVPRWPLKPDSLDWLWCWHDLAPHLEPGELAGRSVAYPLASHHVAGRQGETRRDHLNSAATNLLLLLWPHQTRSITQVPRPAELWRNLASQAISALDDPYALDDVADAAGRDLGWRALQVWLGWTWPGKRPALQQVTTSLRRLQQAAERACGTHARPRN